MPLRIACVVEGQGEVNAVPRLIHRIAMQAGHRNPLVIPPPVRIPKSKLLKQGELEKAVAMAAQQAETPVGVLVLLDSDEDCPAMLGPELLRRARSVRSDVPCSVVLAQTEYESWFVAAAESLRGKCGLAPTLSAPPDLDAIKSAKGWIGRHIDGRNYSPTVDQARLTAAFDLAAARRSPSFDKLCREIERLIAEL